jgi:chromosome segregation ATPase
MNLWITMGLAISLLASGLSCVPVTRNLDALQQPPTSPIQNEAETAAVTSAERFQGPREDQPSTAESMMQLSDQFTVLTGEAVTLRKSNQLLEQENDTLKQQVVALEADLKQTQNELTEANALLMDILGELNTWKSDVLGFRNEMRQAAQAELEALLRILEVLGAEEQGRDVVAVETRALERSSNP